MPNPEPSPAPAGDEAVQADRKKRTVLLMVGGAVSLVLPLCGVVYLRVKEAGESRAPNSSVMFERREAGDAKVAVSQAVVIVNPAAEGLATAAAPSGGLGSSMPVGAPQAAPGGSLGMIKGSGDFLEGEKKAETPAASTQAAKAPVEQGGPISAKKTAPSKGGKKPFVMPKLQSGKGFTSFKGSPKPGGGQDYGGVASPQGSGGDDFLKNLPPGSENNPELQKLLQQQGK